MKRFAVSKITDIHDAYSLPYSTEAKKYGAIVTDFFANAPSEVEDYLIVKNDSDEVRTLQYSVASQGVRFCRKINADGSFEDYQEQLAG
jgi:hypothetical protein